MEFHEAANLFPLDETEIQSLAKDIKKNGLLCPIEVFEGKIIDGRRRFMACKVAGIEPDTVKVNPEDPIAYVLSLNLHRRHLTTSQRSMVGSRAREMYDKQAKERQRDGQRAGGKKRQGDNSMVENLPPTSKARDAAGKAVGVSGKSIDHATRVLNNAVPELIKAVDEGRIAVSTAAIHASDPPEIQRDVAERKKRTYSVPPTAKNQEVEPVKPVEPGKSRGVGIQRAHEAIACLKRIPKNDALRSRGFQVVTDWIRHNQ